MRLLTILGCVLVLALASCSSASDTQPGAAGGNGVNVAGTTTVVQATVPAVTVTTPATSAVASTQPTETIRGGVPVAVIATDRTGSARVQATPFALRKRALATLDTIPPPPNDGVFRSTNDSLAGEGLASGSPSADALARSTWNEDCPVTTEELSYLTMSFVGFDGAPHTGEMIVHADYAADIVEIFAALFEASYPIEEMRIVEPSDLVPPHMGDTNNTSSFACRKVTGGSRFSEHASGLALDINPFQNPYIKGLSVIPALSGSFAERESDRVGVIRADSEVVAAFARIGWEWGGNWNSLKDYQHFSHNGR